MRDGAGAGHVRVNWVLGGSVATARTYESAVSSSIHAGLWPGMNRSSTHAADTWSADFTRSVIRRSEHICPEWGR